jgi:hypothetical protein
MNNGQLTMDNYQLFTINYQLIGDRGFPSYFKGDHQESFLDGNPDRLHIAKRLANDDNDISAQ